MTFALRYYQRDAIDSLYRYFNEATTDERNPLVCMPTGTGKGVVIAWFLKEIFQHWPTTRVMILTHVQELIEQNVKKTLQVWPTCPLGIYSAGLRQKQTVMPIIFGGAQSVVNDIEAFGWRDLLIIDEAHLVSPNGQTRYQKIISKLKEVNPKLRIIGLTATWYRLGQGLLTQGGLFTDICYNICDSAGFTRLIGEGYLAIPIPRTTATQLNVSNVGMNNGEFVQSELQKAIDQADINHAIAKEACEIGHDRKCWLAFCSGIEHADHMADILDSYGIPSVSIHSEISRKERDDRYKAWINGEVRCATNNNVMTTGIDHEPIDFILMIRPTMSTGLWVQMVGRGTRPFPGKANCLVGDWARNTMRLGPIDDPVLPRPPGAKGGGDAPAKVCDACGAINHTRVRFCIACGAEFSFEQKIVRTADTRDILSTGMPQIERYPVDRLIYRRHTASKSGRANIKVTYYCGLQSFSEYVSFDHPGGYALHRAHEWWRQRSVTDPPLSTDIALAMLHTLRTPAAIKVWVNKEHPEILTHEYV